jgi:hypothetical protein
MVKKFQINYLKKVLGGSAQPEIIPDIAVMDNSESGDRLNINAGLRRTREQIQQIEEIEQIKEYESGPTIIELTQLDSYNNKFVNSYKFTNGILMNKFSALSSSAEDNYIINFDKQYNLDFNVLGNIKDINPILNAFLLLKEDGSIIKLKYNGNVIEFPNEINNIKQIVSNDNYSFALKNNGEIFIINVNEIDNNIIDTIYLINGEINNVINIAVNNTFLLILCNNNIIKYYDYKNQTFIYNNFENINFYGSIIKVDTNKNKNNTIYALQDNGIVKIFDIDNILNRFILFNTDVLEILYGNDVNSKIKDINAEYKYLITIDNKLITINHFEYYLPDKYKDDVSQMIVNNVSDTKRTIYIKKIDDSVIKLNYEERNNELLLRADDYIDYYLVSEEILNI